MATSANLSMPLLAEGQASADVTHNTALNMLDAFVFLNVIDRDLTAPPGSPVAGGRYIPASVATGAWAGEEDNIAIYNSGWTFHTPSEGWLMWVADENKLEVYNGAAWLEIAQV